MRVRENICWKTSASYGNTGENLWVAVFFRRISLSPVSAWAILFPTLLFAIPFHGDHSTTALVANAKKTIFVGEAVSAPGTLFNFALCFSRSYIFFASWFRKIYRVLVGHGVSTGATSSILFNNVRALEGRRCAVFTGLLRQIATLASYRGRWLSFRGFTRFTAPPKSGSSFDFNSSLDFKIVWGRSRRQQIH